MTLLHKISLNIYIIFLVGDLRLERFGLRYIRLNFDDFVFTKVNKDRATTFVNMISLIGGTLGLLTGFTIITAVEILYYATKIIFGFFSVFLARKTQNSKTA